MTTAARPDRNVLAAFLATIVLGGSNSVAIKIGNAELAPFWGATLRFGLATVLLAIIAVVARPAWPRGRSLVGSVLYGLFGFAAFYALAYFGLVDAPAGVAQVLIAGAPLLTLLLAVAQRLEKFRYCTRHALSDRATEQLLGLLERLETVDDVSSLMDVMRTRARANG